MDKATEAAISETAAELKPAARAWRFYYLHAFLENFLPLALILLIWEGVARLEIIHPALFPTVTEIFTKMWELTLEGIFLREVLHSFAWFLSSVFFAMILGILRSLLSGSTCW